MSNSRPSKDQLSTKAIISAVLTYEFERRAGKATDSKSVELEAQIKKKNKIKVFIKQLVLSYLNDQSSNSLDSVENMNKCFQSFAICPADQNKVMDLFDSAVAFHLGTTDKSKQISEIKVALTKFRHAVLTFNDSEFVPIPTMRTLEADFAERNVMDTTNGHCAAL